MKDYTIKKFFIINHESICFAHKNILSELKSTSSDGLWYRIGSWTIIPYRLEEQMVWTRYYKVCEHTRKPIETYSQQSKNCCRVECLSPVVKRYWNGRSKLKWFSHRDCTSDSWQSYFSLRYIQSIPYNISIEIWRSCLR